MPSGLPLVAANCLTRVSETPVPLAGCLTPTPDFTAFALRLGRWFDGHAGSLVLRGVSSGYLRGHKGPPCSRW
jgi:hypothetical protein